MFDWCFTYFEVSVESNATPILVAASQRHKIKLFREGCARCDWTTLASLQTSHVPWKLGIHHGHLAVLHHVQLHGWNDRDRSNVRIKVCFIQLRNVPWCSSPPCASCSLLWRLPQPSRRDSRSLGPMWLPDSAYPGRRWIPWTLESWEACGLASAEQTVASW